MLYTQTGTPYYASPEVWKDLPYDSKSDIWSLGCVCYEMCALVPPFRAENMDGLYKRVLKGQFPRVPQKYSNELNHVIKKLLNVNAQNRPNCEQILTSQLIQKQLKKYGLEDIIPRIQNKIDDQVSHEPQQEPTAASEINLDELSRQSVLLNTIQLPKNIRHLTKRLPKANYGSIGAKIRIPDPSRADSKSPNQTFKAEEDHGTTFTDQANIANSKRSK